MPAAAVLRRHRPGDGPRVAPGPLHGHAAGARPRGGDEEPVLRRGPAADRHRGARRLRGRAIARHADAAFPQDHPKEQAATSAASRSSTIRGGPYDFSCATCHGVDGQRIRLQDLPNLANKQDAQRAFTTWPAYRVSQGALRTMQWRLNDCFRQQRFPELEFVSPAIGRPDHVPRRQRQRRVMDSPAIKR